MFGVRVHLKRATCVYYSNVGAPVYIVLDTMYAASLSGTVERPCHAVRPVEAAGKDYLGVSWSSVCHGTYLDLTTFGNRFIKPSYCRKQASLHPTTLGKTCVLSTSFILPTLSENLVKSSLNSAFVKLKRHCTGRANDTTRTGWVAFFTPGKPVKREDIYCTTLQQRETFAAMSSLL
jgi:hypothetical protein